jgi:hypothetical protein
MAHAITVRSAAPVRSRTAAVSVPLAWVDAGVLAALLLAAPLLYAPLLWHNLPVALGIDERNALDVLLRFHHGTLNPGFFQYPTLSFYLVYLLVLPLHYSNTNVLLAGRLLNIELIGVIGFVVYAFCRDRLHSRIAGAIAAVLVLGSTEMAGIVPVHPDLLMVAAGTASLYFLVDYFETRSRRAWAWGLTLMGVSIGCKYTAFILFVAYAATEILASLRQRRTSADQRVAIARFSRRTCVTALLALGGALLLAAWLVPVQPLLAALLRARAVYQPGPGNFYKQAFDHLRRTLAEFGLFSLGLALLCRYVRDVYESIAIKRLYYGLGVILLVAVACTPYLLIRPAQVVFDVGSLTRGNIVVLGGHAQWAAYAAWLLRDEGAAALALGTAGLVLFATRANRRFHMLLIFVALHLYVLGRSKIGYPRYLLPVVALLAVGAGWASVRLWELPAGRSRSQLVGYLRRGVVVLLVGGALVQMVDKVAAIRQWARTTDSFFASYTAVKRATTGTAFYALYAPAVELEEAGVRTRELSWESISAGPLGQHLACGDTLTLSSSLAQKNHVEVRRDASVDLLLDAPGPGLEAQLVLRKHGCP